MSENGNALLELRWQMQSKYTVMMAVPLFEQLCCNGVTLPETLQRIRLCLLEMERAQMMTVCKSTLSRKARRRTEANTTTSKEIARPARPTRALQTSTRARTVAELDIGRRTAGDQVEEHTTIPPVTTATRRKAIVQREKQTRGRCGNESAF